MINTVSQPISIVDGKYYAVTINRFLAGNVFFGPNADFPVGQIGISLGNSPEIIYDIKAINQLGFFLIQAVSPDAASQIITIRAVDGLRNAQIISVSVKQCSDTDLVTNGGFVGSAAGWTLGGTWTYGSNNVSHGGGVGSDNLTQAIAGATTGNNYAMHVDSLLMSVSGGFTVSFGGSSQGLESQATQSNSFFFESITSSHTIFFNATNATATLTGVSLREVTGSELIDANNWVFTGGWKAAGDGGVFHYGSTEGDTTGINQSVDFTGTTGPLFQLSFRVSAFFPAFLILANPQVATTMEIIIGDDNDTEIVATCSTQAGSVNKQIDLSFITSPATGQINFTFANHVGFSYTKVTNVSLKEVLGPGSFGPELITNGGFVGGPTPWSFGDNASWGGPGFLLFNPSTTEYLQTVFMVGAATDGTVQQINVGKADDGTPIYFELETQELEFGDRSHLKKIANKMGVFAQFGANSNVALATDSQSYSPVRMTLEGQVNIGKDLNVEGHYVMFKWFGQSSTASAVLQGFYFEDVTDLGMVYG